MANKKKKKAVKKKKTVANNKKKSSNIKKKNTRNNVKGSVNSAVKKNTKSNVNNSLKNTTKKNPTSKNKDNVISIKNNVEKNGVSSANFRKKKDINSTNKNKKIFVLIAFFLVLILCIFVFFKYSTTNNSKDSFYNISFDEYLDLYKKEELEFIYLYHSSCMSCDSYEEKLIKLEKEFEIKLKKFDYSKLDDSELSILKSSNIFLEDGIGVPMIISIKNGNEISSVSGIKEYSALKNFVNLSKSEHGINKFNVINVDEYLSIMNSKEKSVIYICDSSNSCNKFSSVLEEVSSDRKIRVNYLNTSNITSSDDWQNLEMSNKIFEDMWFMPVIMIVKDNKVISYKMETLSKDALNNFFKKSGL